MASITSTGSGLWGSTTPGAPWPSGVVPGAGDTVIVAATSVISIDQAATISVGADSATAAISISTGGTLQYLSTAANNLTMDLKGDLVVNGTLNIGTLANPIPSSLTAIIKLNDSSSLADGKYGLKINTSGTTGVCNLFGASKTISTTLTADAAANATTFTVNDVTGWAASDTIAIASTSRTATDTEAVTVSLIATKTITILAGGGTGGNSLKAAHGGGGTSQNGVPITAEAINLTLNVKITSTSTTAAGFVSVLSGGTLNAKYCEFSFLGANATNQRGIEFAGTGSSVTFCSVHDARNWGVYFATSTGSNTFSNNVLYNLNTVIAAGASCIFLSATSGAHTLNGNALLGGQTVSGGTVVSLGDAGGVFTNNVTAGCNSGVTGVGIAVRLVETGTTIGTFSGNVCHSNGGQGLRLDLAIGVGTISTCTVWRNGAQGIVITATWMFLTLSNSALFGNANANVELDVASQFQMLIIGCMLNGDSTFSTTSGLSVQTCSVVTMINCSFGATRAHTQDIQITNNNVGQITTINCILGSATQVARGNMQMTTVKLQRIGQTTVYKTLHGMGTITAQSVTTHTASGLAWQMQPLSATLKLICPGPTAFDTFKKAVAANVPITITVWVNYDGSYNGNMPRLVLVGGILQGIANDVVATAAISSSNTWQQLSVSATPTETGVIEWYVDTDGTAGSCYVDDMGASVPDVATNTMDVPSRGLPAEYAYAVGSGGLHSHALRRGR